MFIQSENLDGETFIDVYLSGKDLEDIRDFMLLTKNIIIDGKLFNIGFHLQRDYFEDFFEDPD